MTQQTKSRNIRTAICSHPRITLDAPAAEVVIAFTTAASVSLLAFPCLTADLSPPSIAWSDQNVTGFRTRIVTTLSGCIVPSRHIEFHFLSSINCPPMTCTPTSPGVLTALEYLAKDIPIPGLRIANHRQRSQRCRPSHIAIEGVDRGYSPIYLGSSATGGRNRWFAQ